MIGSCSYVHMSKVGFHDSVDQRIDKAFRV